MASLLRLALLSSALAAGLVVGPGRASAQEPDSLVLVNGNVLYGEIQELSRGKLSFDTDAMNIVSVDWDDILYVTSPQFFEVTDSRRQLYYGEILSADRQRVLVLSQGGSTIEIPFSDVVELRSLAEGFWSKTAGYVDVGANLSRANDLRSLLLKSYMSFSGRIWQLDLQAETYYQSQTTKGTTEGVLKQQTSRNSGTLGGRRFIDGRWAVEVSFKGETNEELSLDFRGLASLGPRYNVVRTSELEFHMGMGGVFNRERFSGQELESSFEIRGAAGFDMFDVGDFDVYLTLEGYQTPSTSRLRINFDGKVAWEIISDLTVGASVLERFDSSPGENAAKRDFQYSFTLGWKWD